MVTEHFIVDVFLGGQWAHTHPTPHVVIAITRACLCRIKKKELESNVKIENLQVFRFHFTSYWVTVNRSPF